MKIYAKIFPYFILKRFYKYSNAFLLEIFQNIFICLNLTLAFFSAKFEPKKLFLEREFLLNNYQLIQEIEAKTSSRNWSRDKLQKLKQSLIQETGASTNSRNWRKDSPQKLEQKLIQETGVRTYSRNWGKDKIQKLEQSLIQETGKQTDLRNWRKD